MNGECVIGARHEAEIKALQDRCDGLDGDNKEQWTAINAVRGRLPPWATAAISLLTFLVGILATIAFRGG